MTSLVRRVRTRGNRHWLEAAVVWALPVIVLGAVYVSPRHVLSAQTAVTALVGLGIVVLAAKRPDRSILILIVLFPFQTFLLSLLYRAGLPGSLVYHLGSWKELLAIGVVIAGVRNLIATRTRLDALDQLALAFVSLVALYAVLQPEIVPGAPSTSSLRLLGFRETAGLVLVLFGARHAPLGPGFARRAGSALIAVGAIVSALGVYEALNPSGWNQFVVHTIRYPQYELGVLHTRLANSANITIYGSVGGGKIVRIGSVFVDELILSFWLVLPFAAAFERVVRRTATPPVIVAAILIGAALLLTQTRSAILAALLVAFLALQPAAGRPRHWRTQVALVLAAVALLAVPLAFTSHLASRVAATNTAADNSSAGHVTGLSNGLSTVAAHPLGRGLSTGAGTGQRYHVANTTIPENQYLEIGDELGVLPMLVFIALTIVLLVKLRGAAREDDDPLTTAAWAAGLGLAVSALFLQTWVDFGVAWTYWGIAGAMLGLAERSWAPVAQPEAEPGRRMPLAPVAGGWSS
jgi:O-Antigen ligase